MWYNQIEESDSHLLMSLKIHSYIRSFIVFALGQPNLDWLS